MNVSLREITAESVRKITSLAVGPDQGHFVATNAESLAQALFSPEAWYRAIYLNEEPVGFVMLHDETRRPTPPARPQISLWRFMIDTAFQRQGIGGAALRQIIEQVRSRNVVRSLLLSYVPGEGSPEGFYEKFGFVANGEVEDGEIVMELALQRGGESE